MTHEYRTCRDCHQSLPIAHYAKNKGSRGGRLSYCNTCRKIKLKTDPYQVFRKIYLTQQKSSKKRGHHPPAYSFEELVQWAEEQPLLTEIWETYQASGHDKDLVPSVDRKNDKKGYTLDNIRLTTWAENNDKANAHKREGLLGKSRPVYAYHKDGTFYKKYVSSAEAARDTGAHPSDILEVANGVPRRKNGGMYCLKSAKGYLWRWD